MSQPTEQQLKILKNLEAGKDFTHGFVHQENAVRAMFQCLTAGWVSRHRLTAEGRAILEAQKPLKGNYEITAVKSEPIQLPPSSLFNPQE